MLTAAHVPNPARSSPGSRSLSREHQNHMPLGPYPRVLEGKLRFIRRALLHWRKKAGRAFWWRAERDPYRLALVEVLLRQTRASTTEQQIAEFVSRYASPGLLFGVPLATLTDDLRPFGLHRQRATQLRELGEYLSARANKMPRHVEELLQLPAIGPYAASAIRCFAFGAREPVVDVNVARIVQRVFGIHVERGEPRRNSEIWRIARLLVRRGNPRLLNWALLDLGALICTQRNPKCEICPIMQACRWAQERRCIA